ncbi:MAG TPA: VanZ family protein [Thermodesulfovibrionales bacterium]|nr:VanZ family protein [Thermodesulfovibrionales bacterium]
MSYNRILIYWSPVILWMGFIFWMSSGTFSSDNTSSIIKPFLLFLFPRISPQEIDMVHGIIRKCGHVGEYFILGLLLFRAFRAGSNESRMRRWTSSAFLVVLLYAASDELHQSFVATRTASFFDIAIDAVGGVLAQGVSALRQCRHKKQPPNF